MKVAVVYIVLALFLIGGLAMAQEAPQNEALENADPLPLEAAQDYHYITGFRSAHFGMVKSQVRAAIAQDFGVAEDAVEEMLVLDQGTTVLAVAVPSLSPGPGPASIFYILGATTGELNYINVIWTTSATPTPAERERIAVAGLQLAYYFENLGWKPGGSVSGVSLSPGEVLTFAGVDPEDSGVQVIVSGVPMTDGEGNAVDVSGPARLQISYSARFGAPDVAAIESGSF